MTTFFVIGGIINLVALVFFVYWAVGAWKRADPALKRPQSPPVTEADTGGDRPE